MHLLFYTPFPWKIFFVMCQRAVEVVSGGLGSVCWHVNILLGFLQSWFFVLPIHNFFFGWSFSLRILFPPLFFEKWMLLIPFYWGRCAEMGNFINKKYTVNVSLVQPCQWLIVTQTMLKVQTSFCSHWPLQNWWIPWHTESRAALSWSSVLPLQTPCRIYEQNL